MIVIHNTWFLGHDLDTALLTSGQPHPAGRTEKRGERERRAYIRACIVWLVYDFKLGEGTLPFPTYRQSVSKCKLYHANLVVSSRLWLVDNLFTIF